MKIIVTGALGHIGSKLIRALPDEFSNSDIIMIDNLSTCRYPSLFNLPKKNYKFIEGDVTKLDFDPLVDEGDIIIHLAALTDAENSFENRRLVESINYSATKNVAKACASNGGKLIYPSSTSIYGTQNNVVNENCNKNELNPQSPYAETKLKEEYLLYDMAETHKLEYVIFRFGTIYGISPGMRFHTAVNKFCWQAIMQQPLTVWSTALDQKRPYLELNDGVNAFIYAIKKEIIDCQIYNVLTSNNTVKDILNIIELSIPNIEIEYVEKEIMNQLSYEVSNKKYMEKGFKYNGVMKNSIDESLRILSSANNRGL